MGAGAPAGSMDTEAGLSYPPAEQWWVSPAACSISRKLAVGGVVKQHGGLLSKESLTGHMGVCLDMKDIS